MVVKSILDGARHRFRVAAAEVGYHDQWQRAELGFAVVAGTPRHADRGHRRGRPLRVVAPGDRGAVDRAAVVGVSRGRRSPRPALVRQVPRTARLNELLREVVAEELERIDDERLELVSDHRDRRRRRPEPGHRLLRLAGRRGRRRRGARGARRAPPVRLQAAIGRQIHARKTPVLEFRPDDVIRSAERIERDPAPTDHRRVERRAAPSRRRPPTVHGLCVVDKPAGMTSHDVVAKCRAACCGTPQSATPARSTPTPPACCCSASASVTRLLRFLTALAQDATRARSCSASRRRRSTPPATSTAATTWPASRSTTSAARVAAHLTGPIEQVPPMVSAVKVGGRRLHELARRGHRGRAGAPAGHRAPLRRGADRRPARSTASTSTCSSGTYVRSLAADLGHAARRRRPPARPAPHGHRVASPRPRPARSTPSSCCRRRRRRATRVGHGRRGHGGPRSRHGGAARPSAGRRRAVGRARRPTATLLAVYEPHGDGDGPSRPSCSPGRLGRAWRAVASRPCR